MTTEPEDLGVEFGGVTIREDDVKQFLEQVGARDAKCPACNNNVWHVLLTPGDSRSIAFPVMPIDDESTRLPVAVAACATCGFLRPHALSKIHDWIKSKQGSLL